MRKSCDGVCRYGPTNSFTLSSPIGNLLLVCCTGGVHEMHSMECLDSYDMDVKVEVQEKLYDDNGYTHKVVFESINWLNAYFAASPDFNSISLPKICTLSTRSHFSGTFRQQVWQALVNSVPLGDTCSYKTLAELISKPKAMQSVGQALKHNPVIIFVPCHRVIRSDGKIGSYDGGRKNNLKNWLLSHEEFISKN